MKPDHRYRSLDAIRGIAAVGVALFHYRNHFETAPFAGLLGPVYQRGAILVDVFFVMSGYLLATIYAGRRDVGTLAWRRIARLAPLHWLMLAVVAIEQFFIRRRYGVHYIYEHNDAYHFGLNLLLLQNTGLSSGLSFDGPAWSISVEWLVNLLLFALLFIVPKRVPLAATAMALLAALALWDHGQNLQGRGVYKGVFDALLLRGAVGFFVGVALTAPFPLDAASTSPARRFVSPRLAGHLWDLVLLLSTGALIAFMAASDATAQRPGVDFSVGIVVIPALIVAAVRGHWAARVLAFPPLQWLGWISYSIYLVHFPMQAAFILLFHTVDRRIDYGQPAVFAGYLAATLAVSYLTWRFVEVPAQKWLQRVALQRRD